MCSERIQLPLHRERTYGKNRRTTVKNLFEAMPWVQFEVCDGDGRIYPFLIPLQKGDGIEDHTTVRATGRWIERDGAWHLVLAKLTIFDFHGRSRTHRFAKIGRKVTCRYCGADIIPEARWGFDRTLRVECWTCFDFRNGRSPRDFLAHCRRIACNNRKDRDADLRR